MSYYPLIRWLVVKGVCDYADRMKSDAYHDYTARASALYALSFIRAYVTNERLPRSDGSSQQAFTRLLHDLEAEPFSGHKESEDAQISSTRLQ